jgi:hypothetical protein
MAGAVLARRYRGKGTRARTVNSHSFRANKASATTAAEVALSIAHLVSAKVIEGPVSSLRKRAVIAVMWIKAVIHVAEEAM